MPERTCCLPLVAKGKGWRCKPSRTRMPWSKRKVRMLAYPDGDVAPAMAQHASPVVRTMAMKHPHLPLTVLEAGLNDEMEAVRHAALEAVLRREAPITVDRLLPHAAAGNHVVGILIWATANAPEHVETLASHLVATDIKRLVDHMRASVESSDDPLVQRLLGAKILEPVARWVARQGRSEDELRWALIDNEELALVERSKLLERLIGRAAEPEVQARVNALLERELGPLLKGACENLSTAASELSS